MKECEIVKDLLPLVAEDMASDASKAFVQEHIETCAECKAAYERLKTPVAAEPAAPLKTVRKQVKHRGMLITGLVACLVAGLLIAGFARVTKPIPITSVEEAFENVTVEGNHLKLTIREDVTVRSTISGNNEFIDMLAYRSSFVDTWFNADNTIRLTERSIDTDLSDGTIKAVFFQPFDGTDQVLLYAREGYTPEAGFALPRLVMNYWFLIALTATIVLFIPWLVLLFKKSRVRRVFDILLLIPACVTVAFLFAGFPATTIAPLRDLIFVCIIAVLLFGAGLSARALFRKD